MPDMVKLRSELVGDPLGRGYAGMSDAAALTSLRTVNRTLPRDTVPVYEVREAITLADWNGLTAAQREYLTMLFQSDVIYNKAGNIRTALGSIFAGKTTLTNLQALQTRAVSRLEELGIGLDTTEGDIVLARSGTW